MSDMDNKNVMQESENLQNDEVTNEIFEYSAEPFIIITEDNQSYLIEKFCDAVFASNLTDYENEFPEIYQDSEKSNFENEDYNKSALGKRFLISFLQKLTKPVTVVQEMYHIDSSYRDTY